MAKKKIAILGAGLAGLSVAWHLQRQGIPCEVFEKEPQVGGLCRSKKISGFTFDYDGHLLHFRQQYTFNLVKNLLEGNLTEHQRNAFIYSFGKYRRYPFQANLYGLPAPVVKECLLGFLAAHRNGNGKKTKDKNFLKWITLTFGQGIARHFMEPYNYKFWTLPPAEITSEWAQSFIPIPTLSQIIEGTLEESKRLFGYNAHFWYPKRGGIGVLPEALRRQIKNIHTRSEVVGIDLKRHEMKLARGQNVPYDILIFTSPLPQMRDLIMKMPQQVGSSFAKLKWNSIFNLNLGIERQDTSNRHWIYFPQGEISFFRVGFPHNFSGTLAPKGKSSLYAEVSYSEFRPIDKKKIARLIERDLKKVGIITQNERVSVRDAIDIKYGYPIYDANYSCSRENIIKFLRQNDLWPCGRYGSWRYMSMEDVILDGAMLADNLKERL